MTDPASPYAVFDDPAGEDFTVGVEEAFFVIDAETRQLRADADQVPARATSPAGSVVDAELERSQVESGSAVCRDLEASPTSLLAARCCDPPSGEQPATASTSTWSTCRP